VASGAAWISHVLLDWLGTDGTPPIGIMALWPWSDGFYESTLHLFAPIERRWWMPNFLSHNLAAAAREAVVLLPVVWFVWWRGGRNARRATRNDGDRPVGGTAPLTDRARDRSTERD
jgi:hypothetical protein